jgi:D-alanine-D-alanine ligase-like ATP-grasp enzyme
VLNAENEDFNPNYVRQDLIQKVKEAIVHSLESVRKKLKITTNQKGQGSCFELFGYDFIIDASFGVWLIEVNTNPCLEESS